MIDVKYWNFLTFLKENIPQTSKRYEKGSYLFLFVEVTNIDAENLKFKNVSDGKKTANLKAL